MGTHPIFESDFDCLTEMENDISKSNRKEQAGHVNSELFQYYRDIDTHIAEPKPGLAEEKSSYLNEEARYAYNPESYKGRLSNMASYIPENRDYLIRDEEREKILRSRSHFNFKNQDAEQSRKGNVAMDLSQMIHGHMMNMPAEGIDKMMSALKV